VPVAESYIKPGESYSHLHSLLLLRPILILFSGFRFCNWNMCALKELIIHECNDVSIINLLWYASCCVPIWHVSTVFLIHKCNDVSIMNLLWYVSCCVPIWHVLTVFLGLVQAYKNISISFWIAWLINMNSYRAFSSQVHLLI
jgi:hypothetical protein